MGRKLVAVVALLVVVGVGVAWLIPDSAFRKVQKAILARSSVTCRVTRGSDRSVRVMILDNGRSRLEWPNGNYTIADASKSRKLFVNPKERKARLEEYGSPNLYEHEVLRDLQNVHSVRALPPEELDGREVLGFFVPHVDDYIVTVWVEADTKLPVRIEAKYWGKGDNGRVTIIDDFVFDQELDAQLFTLEPPAGYKIRSQSLTVQPLPSDPQLRDPVVTPLAGIGPVKFGMSSAEVEKLLGEPDNEDLKVPGAAYISYHSRGILIIVDTALGVQEIRCNTHRDATRGRSFGGKTNRGISLGDSKDDVVHAYGQPSWTNSSGTYMEYQKLGTGFSFYNDRLTSMWFLDSPMDPRFTSKR